MKRRSVLSMLAAAAALLGGLSLLEKPAQAQFKCYPSYVTMSGTCPDSCGRGADCPCTTCKQEPV